MTIGSASMLVRAGRFLVLVFLSGGLFAMLHAGFDPPSIFLRGSEGERAAVLETLKTFNAIWSDFYATDGVPAMIDEFPAAKMVKHGIFRDTGWLESMDRVQVYDLARMEPLEVRFSADGTAEADVYEEWNFVIQEKSTRRPVTEVKGMGQGFRYRLKQEEGRWFVTGWDPLDLPAPPPVEGFPF